MDSDCCLSGEDFFDRELAEVVDIGDNKLGEELLTKEVTDGGRLWGDGGSSAGL
jgi:hypothetical protein